MPKITGVSGSDLKVQCAVSGYPIESIVWERDGQTLPINRRQRVYNNGSLIIEQLQRSEDAGMCLIYINYLRYKRFIWCTTFSYNKLLLVVF